MSKQDWRCEERENERDEYKTVEKGKWMCRVKHIDGCRDRHTKTHTHINGDEERNKIVAPAKDQDGIHGG